MTSLSRPPACPPHLPACLSLPPCTCVHPYLPASTPVCLYLPPSTPVLCFHLPPPTRVSFFYTYLLPIPVILPVPASLHTCMPLFDSLYLYLLFTIFFPHLPTSHTCYFTCASLLIHVSTHTCLSTPVCPYLPPSTCICFYHFLPHLPPSHTCYLTCTKPLYTCPLTWQYPYLFPSLTCLYCTPESILTYFHLTFFFSSRIPSRDFLLYLLTSILLFGSFIAIIYGVIIAFIVSVSHPP